jgi:hypothetical protein
MPPRKTKIVAKPRFVEDSPVVFFLKISDDLEENIVIPSEESTLYSDVILAGEPKSYSDILQSVEISKLNHHFNTDLLKTVLDKFTGVSYSPHTACFWCCHTFGWVNSSLPVSYDAYKNLYVSEGYFCSPECALAYNYADPHASDSSKWNRHSLLEFLYSEIYKTRSLSPAPPRTLLRMFGGPLDIEQYREYLTTENDIVLSNIAPVRLIFPSMNVQGPLRDIKKYVSLSNDVLEKASEQLRLKRSKPMNTNVQTLDMCIGKNR